MSVLFFAAFVVAIIMAVRHQRRWTIACAVATAAFSAGFLPAQASVVTFVILLTATVLPLTVIAAVWHVANHHSPLIFTDTPDEEYRARKQ